jgi:hypothetical protein
VIVFILTREHPYTVGKVAHAAPELDIRTLTYDQLFEAKQFPRATYVFTDFDRLPHWKVRDAAYSYRRLRDEGARVLNDPAQALSRLGLLRRLYRHGLNGFDAYRVEDGIMPARWPVLLRTEGGHDAPLNRLLHDWDELRRAIETAVGAGVPVASLLVIEYAAEPVRPGLFRKLSVYRLGDSYVASYCVHEDNWVAKHGKDGIAPPELYADDLRIVRENPFEASQRTAFELGSVEYGRSDFGLVGGRPQVYEINTNPHIKLPSEHPSEIRVESYRLFQRNFLEALARIDTPASA